MAIEVIDQANPPPLASQLPEDCLLLAQKLNLTQLDKKTHENIKAFRRAADYIAAGKYSYLEEE
jgi:xylulose-5-phosphate/fructose-6-phosphate phosphoketolase